MVYLTDTEVSFLMSCSIKGMQYMDQTTSQLHSIWTSVPKDLYRQVEVKVKEKLRSLTLRSVFYTVLVCVS